MVLVHRLVQAVTRSQLTAQASASWVRAARALVETALPAEPIRPAAWPVYAVLLPHARAVLDLTGCCATLKMSVAASFSMSV